AARRLSEGGEPDQWRWRARDVPAAAGQWHPRQQPHDDDGQEQPSDRRADPQVDRGAGALRGLPPGLVRDAGSEFQRARPHGTKRAIAGAAYVHLTASNPWQHVRTRFPPSRCPRNSASKKERVEEARLNIEDFHLICDISQSSYI